MVVSDRAGTEAAAGADAHHVRGAQRIHSHTFAGSFVPEQVVSAGGRVWLVGTSRPGLGGGCGVEPVNPVTLDPGAFLAIPRCGPNIAVGDGYLYLTGVTYQKGTNNETIQIERVDTATDHVTLLAPVVMTLVGSAIAHTAMTYGEGSLWLDGYDQASKDGAAEVVQISPATGGVINTITGVPAIGGAQPAMVANRGGLWLASGAGGTENLDRVPPGGVTPASVFQAPSPGSILWLAALGSTVWADVAQHGGTLSTTRLTAFDPSGREVRRTLPGQISGWLPAGADGRLWSLGGGACSGPQQVWEVNTGSGRSVVAATLRPPVDWCNVGPGSEVAAIGRAGFVLDPSYTVDPTAVLYRVQG